MRGASPAGGSVCNLAKFGVTGFSDRTQRPERRPGGAGRGRIGKTALLRYLAEQVSE